MKLKLDFEPLKSEKKLHLGDSITLLGSCFSDEIAILLKKSGFKVVSNPFGTIFHPTALANLLITDSFEPTILQRDDLFFSWVGSGTLYDVSKESLLTKLNDLQISLFEAIRSSSFLYITFGTAYGYERRDYTSVVANCHKMPNDSFMKVLSSVGEMMRDWEISLERIYTLNPNIQIVFTVSPVRHIKDGLVENNRSKARLIELTNQLTISEKELYFPSYELLIDILRDYRFYKEDLVHPSQQTVDYIYDIIEQVFMSSDTQKVTKQVRKLRELTTHQLLYPESVKSTEFEVNTKNKIAKFLTDNPLVNW